MKVELGRAERAFWVVLFTAVAAHLLAYALVAYPALPQTVPTHWAPTVRSTAGATRRARSSWRPCRSSSRSSCSPCRASTPRGRNFERFRGVYALSQSTLFMAVVSWMTPLTAFGLIPEGGSLVSTIILFALGALMIALGNYLPRVRPNYTFGIRTPWTLASEDNWRRTHRFAGPVFVAAGVVMLVAAALSTVAPDVSFWAGMAAVLVSTLVVGAYSFVIWRRAER